MDNITNISVPTFIGHVFFHLTGFECEDQSIIRVNNENLSANGDLYLLPSLKLWKAVLVDKLNCNESCNDILQHYAHTRDTELKQEENVCTTEKVLRSLVSASQTWNLKIGKCTLQKERVCLFLDRPSSIKAIINEVVRKGASFGRRSPIDESIRLTFQPDEQSELTSTRLRLIKEAGERILDLQGYRVGDKNYSSSVVLTSKSHCETSQDSNRYLCGVVKNSEKNTKETSLTWSKYVHGKIEALMELNEDKYLGIDDPDANEESFLLDMAEATIAFELLAVKPSRPVFINLRTDTDRSLTNTKGAPFILYNTARIAAIIEKYNRGVSNGEYLDLTDIEAVDYSVLNDEDEWELVYSFLAGYSQAIESAIRHKPTLQICPQVICMFLSRLCQKFSIYYRRIKILTEGYEHLHSKLVARIYILKALEIVLQNALAIFNIKSVSRM